MSKALTACRVIESPTSDDRQGLSGIDVASSRLSDSRAVKCDAKKRARSGEIEGARVLFSLGLLYFRDEATT